MSAFTEQPFSEPEERYFLAEILKVSIIPPFHLLGFIEQMGVQPVWDEIALPNGRSVAACQRAFTRLRSRHELPVQMRSQTAAENPLAPPKPRKRQSAGDLSAPSHQAPGFSSFPSVNQPNPAHGIPSVTTPGGKPQKKRGRPSKAEHELRAAEAAARGEVYPPPKKIKIPKTPAEEGTSIATTGGQVEAGTLGMSETPEVKKRVPKVKAPKGPQAPSDLEATATAATELGQSSQPVAPATPPTDAGPSESLLAGLQEHAARTETNPTEQQQSAPQVESLPATQTEPFLPPQNEPYQTPYQQTSSA